MNANYSFTFFKGSSPVPLNLLRWLATLDKYARESLGNRNTGKKLRFLGRVYSYLKQKLSISTLSCATNRWAILLPFAFAAWRSVVLRIGYVPRFSMTVVLLMSRRWLLPQLKGTTHLVRARVPSTPFSKIGSNFSYQIVVCDNFRDCLCNSPTRPKFNDQI